MRLTIEEAISETKNGKGTQFHPIVVDAFLEMLRRKTFIGDNAENSLGAIWHSDFE